MKRSAGILVLLALLAGACARSIGDGGSAGELVSLGGTVHLLRGGETIAVDGEVALAFGDEVVTDDGRARIALPGNQAVELAPDSRIHIADSGVPRLMAGSILVTAFDGLTVRAREDTVEAQDAVFRLSGEYNTSVGVYRGAATVVDARTEVPALRELDVVAGDIVPRGPRPLTVRPNDPWDARLLGPAIDLGMGIERLQRGLAGQLRSPRGRAAVAEVLRGEFSGPALSRLLRAAEPADYAELVVAGQIALQAAKDGQVAPLAVLDHILGLRDDGAQWIVVVAEWKVLRVGLLGALATLTGVIARTLSEGNDPPSASTSAPGTGAGSPPAPAGSGDPAPPTDNNPNDPPGEKDPPKKDPPPPDDECSGPLDCVVDGLLQGVSG